MTASLAPGKIITFYSYKGGTGRSMALANVAWILASAGKRVLVLDWDLEAPGLHRYFHPFLPDTELTSSEGLIDFMIDFVAEAVTPSEGTDPDWYIPHANILRYAFSLNWEFPKPGTLDFVPAGRQGPDYAIRVNSFNWQRFYEDLGGGVFLEAAKQSMAEYDYVLIDSRTGVSDTSGICTIQMPDLLVVCFTLNSQSIDGAAAVADSVQQQRLKENGEPGLQIFPVPMRVERAEKQKLELALEDAREKFEPFLWHIPEQNWEAYWGSIQVFYEPFYAFEEVLATFRDMPLQTGSLLSSMEVLTAYLTQGGQEAVTQLVPPKEDQRQEVLAKYSRRRKPVLKPARTAQYQYWFYFSYARRDLDRYARMFFDDLYQEFRSRTGLSSEALGFFDTAELHTGEAWPATISEALRTSRAAVCLFSPAYLASEFCGKEFQVFQDRLSLYHLGAVGSMAILPVVWIPPSGAVGNVIAQLQSASADFPPAYVQEGLRYLMRLRKHQDDYQAFVSQFARLLVQAAETYPLPALASLPPFAEIRSAFAEIRSAFGESQSSHSAVRTGPQYAEFAFAAAAPSEISIVRKNLQPYGDEGGRDWRPYGEPIGLFAQRAATQERLIYQEIPLGSDLPQRLHEAEANNRVVILVVDPWTLMLQSYHAILRAFDTLRLFNCAILVVWNEQDEETVQHRAQLEQAVRLTFMYKDTTDKRRFLPSIQSADQFRLVLQTTLHVLRAEILQTGTVLRKAESVASIKPPFLYPEGRGSL
jgi:FxsC-like protein